MKTLNARFSLAVIIPTVLLVAAPGCQNSDLHNNSLLSPRSEKAERLSDRQIAELKLSLGCSLEQRGDVEGAMATYREAVAKNAKSATGFWRMAVLHDRKGEIQESERLYRQALDIAPKNADIHCDYGYSLYLQRRWAEAEDHLRQALAVKSNHLRAHNNLGLVLAQNNCFDEALAEFRKAGCKEADARANLAFVLTLDRRWDEAREHYALALEADPRSETAKTGLEKLNGIVAKAAETPSQVALASYEEPAAQEDATDSSREPRRRKGRVRLETSEAEGK